MAKWIMTLFQQKALISPSQGRKGGRKCSLHKRSAPDGNSNQSGKLTVNQCDVSVETSHSTSNSYSNGRIQKRLAENSYIRSWGWNSLSYILFWSCIVCSACMQVVCAGWYFKIITQHIDFQCNRTGTKMITGGATNDYFHYQLIYRLFSQTVDQLFGL